MYVTTKRVLRHANSSFLARAGSVVVTHFVAPTAHLPSASADRTDHLHLDAASRRGTPCTIANTLTNTKAPISYQCLVSFAFGGIGIHSRQGRGPRVNSLTFSCRAPMPADKRILPFDELIKRYVDVEEVSPEQARSCSVQHGPQQTQRPEPHRSPNQPSRRARGFRPSPR
jgi:hypothetical protein